MDNIKVLSLNNDTFWELKSDFDSILMKTLANMQEKNASEAAITLKLGISLIRETVKDVTCPEGKVVVRPSFKHDISSVMQIKAKLSGAMFGEDQLVYDPDTDEYVLKPIEDGQISFFGDQYKIPDEKKKSISCFDRLLPYVGKDLYIQKCDFGYGVCCADEWVIPHYEEEDSPLFIPQETYEIHEEEGLECLMEENENGDKHIQIVGIESDVCLLSVAQEKITTSDSGYEIEVDLDSGEVSSYEYDYPIS